MQTQLKYIFLSIACCFIFQDANTQRGVSFFVETELERMMHIAKRENKNIFVDTYTEWCVPCKKLDKEFLNQELGEYFNEQFVNVKFDMDSPAGKEIHRKYDVFFVPTLLILSPQGELKLKIDQGLISAEELLLAARQVNEPILYASESLNQEKEQVIETKPERSASVKGPIEQVVATAPSTKQKEVPSRTKATITKEPKAKNSSEEKILYVLDSNEEVPAFILLEEAYFRMQLMDGSHRLVAKKYLDTQENWLEEKNVKFIHDFVSSTQSREFAFILKNRAHFNQVLGEEELSKTLKILVNKRLYQGVPRPTKEEALSLFKIKGSSNPEAETLFYLDQRLSLPSN